MKLKTSAGEIHFNPQTVSHVHLNADRTLLTVHFTEGTHAGFDAETVRKILRLVRMSEFKRKQAAPGLKVTDRAFGTGWRMPIAARLTGI